MDSFKDLPKAVKNELQGSLEQRLEEASEVRISKFSQARNFLKLKNKYHFRRNRMGMN